MTDPTRLELYRRGEARVVAFCRLNALTWPEFRPTWNRKDWRFSVCAYYRASYIAICPDACARPGTSPIAARNAWSWPGYSTDRTPYGALAHELGHHVDYWHGAPEHRGAYWSNFSSETWEAAKEPPLTSYLSTATRDMVIRAEWFAEMFRLFVTNAALLKLLRPRTHALLAARFHAVSGADWATELGSDVPARFLEAVAKKVKPTKNIGLLNGELGV
jgi:hypothetical protein